MINMFSKMSILEELNSQFEQPIFWMNRFMMFSKVYLPNLPDSIFRPSFFVFWLRYLKFGMRPPLLMWLKGFRSILGLGSPGATKKGRLCGPQSPKTEIGNFRWYNYSFWPLSSHRSTMFCMLRRSKTQNLVQSL